MGGAWEWPFGLECLMRVVFSGSAVSVCSSRDGGTGQLARLGAAASGLAREVMGVIDALCASAAFPGATADHSSRDGESAASWCHACVSLRKMRRGRPRGVGAMAHEPVTPRPKGPSTCRLTGPRRPDAI